MELSERIRNYVDKMPVAVSGQGGSNACLTVACVLVWGWGLSLEEAMPFMRDYSQRCDPPWSEKELQHKLRSAEKKPSDKGRGYLLGDRAKVTNGGDGANFKPRAMRPVREFVREEWAQINPQAVADFTAGIPVLDEAWFARRSSVNVSSVDSAGFLSAIFEPEDRVLIFSRYYSQGDFIFWQGHGAFRLADERGVQAVKAELPKGGRMGVWYLVQPVSGGWELNGTDAHGRPKFTRRSECNVKRWVHVVLESDELEPGLWMRVVAGLRLPIVAIYTSGGRSIHALVRYPVPSKPDWDVAKKTLEKFVCPLGADPGALSAVRLSRLPGCLRFGAERKVEGQARPQYEAYEKPRMQRLLYLNPGAGFEAIFTMRELRGDCTAKQRSGEGEDGK